MEDPGDAEQVRVRTIEPEPIPLSLRIILVGTDEAYQGRGIGRVLLDALTEHAREVGATSVLLEVRVDNEPALRLYDRAGFEKLGLRRGYYPAPHGKREDAIVMRLGLDPEGGDGVD